MQILISCLGLWLGSILWTISACKVYMSARSGLCSDLRVLLLLVDSLLLLLDLLLLLLLCSLCFVLLHYLLYAAFSSMRSDSSSERSEPLQSVRDQRHQARMIARDRGRS